MEWMILPLKRYFDFRGRSRRKELWMWVLFTIIVTIVLSIVDAVLRFGGDVSGDTDGAQIGGAIRGGLLANLFALATLIPNLSVSVRRLHDLNRTGWWIMLPVGFYLAGLVFIVGGFLNGDLAGAATPEFGGAMIAGFVLFGIGLLGALLLLVWYCMPGTAGPNRFGEDPKGIHTDADEVFG